PEEPEYEYVFEACEKALSANPENARAYYYMASIYNKQSEYVQTIDAALKGLSSETDPIWISALNLELGSAYQNTSEYDKACEAFKQVTEDPFLAKAEKRIDSVGCD
ncbi:MAG: tetratricopeptide repeat protein, partial [Bacteroides sp.]|nr:tetratricopeptide repeat protein [Bacteroides sp.]